jgi:type I restriction enzyme S subunit
VGKTAIYRGEKPAIFAGYIIRVKPILLNSEYLNYLMNSEYHRSICAQVKTDGVNQSNINAQKLSNFLYPIPPLAEQHRIAATTNSAFAIIDEIERNKKDLQIAIATTKSKILSLAICGKLVPQDPSDEPASALLERIRSERESLIKTGKIKRGKAGSAAIRGGDSPYYGKLPDGWEIVTLAEITNPLILNDGDWILSKNMAPSGDVKLIQLGSVGYMEYVDKGFKYLTDAMFMKLNCTAIRSGYLLINRLLGDRLNVCTLPVVSGTLITTVDTCWIAPNDNYDLKFLMYNIASESFQEAVFQNSAGSTRKRISKGKLIQISFLFPPLAEQHRIVTAIETAFEQLDSIITSLA